MYIYHKKESEEADPNDP